MVFTRKQGGFQELCSFEGWGYINVTISAGGCDMNVPLNTSLKNAEGDVFCSHLAKGTFIKGYVSGCLSAMHNSS